MALQDVDSVVLKLSDYLDKPMTGYYLGYKVHENEMGESKIHTIQIKSGKHAGKRISFYGFGILNNMLEQQVSVGELIEVTYIGKLNIQTKFGKKDCHNAKLRVDHDDILASKYIPQANEPEPDPTPAPAKSGKAADPTPPPVATDDDDLPF